MESNDMSIFLSLRNGVVTQRMRENLASETHGSLRVNNQHFKSYNAFKAILWWISWLNTVRLAYLQIKTCRLHQLRYIFVLSLRYGGHNKRNLMRWNNFFSVNILLLHTIFRLLCILPYVIFSIFSLFILRKAPPNHECAKFSFARGGIRTLG